MLDNILKKETLFVGFITVFIYTSVYFFERGSAVALHIPLDLITISLPTVINDYIQFYLFIFPIVAMTFVFLKYLCSKRSQNNSRLAAFFSGIIFALALLRYLDLSLESLFISILLGGGYMALLFLILEYNSPVLNDEEISGEKSNDEYFKFRINKYFSGFLTGGWLILLFSMTFLLMGRYSINTDTFDCFSLDGSKYAIVKIYGDNVFTWQIVDGNLKKELTYFRVKDLNGVTISNHSMIK